MNAVEIEEAISALAELPFDGDEFPFAFLQAFGNKATTIKRLRSGASNKSDQGGVLQTNNIHLKVCAEGEVTRTLAELKASPATTKAKAKLILATDGETLEAEDLTSDVPPIACEYREFPDHFGFFLPFAGISTVKQIRESAFDIKATGRLNRLYAELLKDNPEWGTSARRHDMNHFMARLIFCFFAEDTGIFTGPDQFTSTIERMSEKDSSNTHEVIAELFRAMNTKTGERTAAGIARWANVFPYVNGGLFSGGTDVPRFSRIARPYPIHIGSLDWTKINPDIFGSMIQAVADDEERGALGMHYTSVPNILKVLNPLFLDDLREKLEAAGDNRKKLKALRERIAKIRVFDPACGSGNFLVIAYKEMRSIEAEINERRDEADRRTEIPLTNYRGIELRDFPAEIARLALIIAEYQCDVTYRGQKEALAEFLPLDAMNWMMSGMNGSGFGRAGGPFLRYPGGTACFRIFDTVLRSIPKCRAAALLLIPSTWHARRTRLYSSTEYISPPSARLLQASRCGILLRDGQIIRPIPWVFCLRDSHLPQDTLGAVHKTAVHHRSLGTIPCAPNAWQKGDHHPGGRHPLWYA